MSKEIEIPKKYVSLIVIVILLVLGMAAYSIYNKQPENTNIDQGKLLDYKKTVYDGLVCQYSCELVEGGVKNGITQMVPNRECLSGCLEMTKSKGYDEKTFTEEEVLTDNLFVDIDSVIEECKTLYMVVDDQGSLPQFEEFYACTLEGLDNIKPNYEYLN